MKKFIFALVTLLLITDYGVARPISYELRRIAVKHEFPTEQEVPARLAGESELSMKDYLAYLVDMHLVFSTIEDAIAGGETEELAPLQFNGAERAIALEEDITYVAALGRLRRPKPTQPAKEYADYLVDLNGREPYKLLAHLYILYHYQMAHGWQTAKRVNNALAIGSEGLQAYRYGGKLKMVKVELRRRFDKLQLNHLQVHNILDEEVYKAIEYVDKMIVVQ